MTVQTITKADLLLLGLVLDRPMHGYELYQQIQSDGIDSWFNISAAGVYYSLRKLRDKGLVTESRQQGRGSSRKSIYRSTDRGRAAFFATMETHLAGRERAYLDYDLAVYLLNRLPLRRLLPRLEEHQGFLAEQDREVQALLTTEQYNGRSPLKLAILDHRHRFLAMEQGWLADLVQSIAASSEGTETRGDLRGDLMVLSGSLTQYHLPDLIRLIVAGEHCGTLTITNGSQTGTLSFDSGRPVYASCQRRGDAAPAVSTLEEVLDVLCELFGRQVGHVSFDQRVDSQDWWLPLTLSAEELILRGCRKVDNWVIIQRLVPSAATIFEQGPGVRHLETLTLLPDEDRILRTVDGVRDVATVAHELDLTLFEASRVFYCLAAIGVVRAADLEKARLRRVFREIAELMCNSTIAWRSSPEDRSCEAEVNRCTADLPLQIEKGRIKDLSDPQLDTDELREMYHRFLQEQFRVVSDYFGHSNASESFQRTLSQLAPELQDVAKRHGFDRLGTQ
ncbi:DUF4388 domain-containing protein [Chloroflexota bacterium]